ncbi:DapH/DapD/GlmU-related protein [Virgibacillus soli]|uniref:DapH/DapD/GlmU-related protein n=1 Tax=Paracerasibacillus soli TaxID=480284 RepID=A0ABU5CVK4_9BACI|nr:DapH/DapD/GlmU-related protein [Virgibacillus soli]MDY0410356.1 DapH/DapD/GlmU-related protein [Virgibacillus soli]
MIDQTVTLGENVKIGEYVVLEENVMIGNNVEIGNHVIIKEGTIISDDVTIQDHAILGKPLTKFKHLARKPKKEVDVLLIGERAVIGSHAVLYRGSKLMDDVFVGDMASIRENVIVGEKSIIGRNAMVENNTTIGKGVTIQTSSYVTADMVIEDNVFIGPSFSSSNDKYMGMGNVELKGPTLKKGAKIGNNASLLPGITIGVKAVVGAGAVVTKDVTDGKTVVGNPAQVLEKK